MPFYNQDNATFIQSSSINQNLVLNLDNVFAIKLLGTGVGYKIVFMMDLKSEISEVNWGYTSSEKHIANKDFQKILGILNARSLNRCLSPETINNLYDDYNLTRTQVSQEYELTYEPLGNDDPTIQH